MDQASTPELTSLYVQRRLATKFQTMTTTTPGCPATNYLKAGAGEAASAVEGVEFVDVKLTYEPRWTPEMMAPEAKLHFGIRDGGGW